MSSSLTNQRRILFKSMRKHRYSYMLRTLTENLAARLDSVKSFGDIPGPRPLPLIGNRWRYWPIVGSFPGVTSVKQFYLRLNDLYGDIIAENGLLMPSKKSILLFSPNDIQKVFQNDGLYPIRYTLDAFVYYRTVVNAEKFKDFPAFVAVQGKPWQEARFAANPALMRPNVLNHYIDGINHVAGEFLERVETLRKIGNKKTSNEPNEMPDNFLDELNKWSLESTALMALDLKLGCLKNDDNSETQEFINVVSESFKLLAVLERTTLWRWWPTKTYRKFVHVMDVMTRITKKYVDIAKQRIKMKKIDDANGGKGLSALEYMLKTNEKYAMTFSLDVMMAGVDTVSRTTANTLYLLATNQSKQAILRAELREHIPRGDGQVTLKTLENLTYLKACLKEANRIAPVATMVSRTLSKDLVLSGYHVPAGTTIFGATFILSTMDKYFPQPDSFIPERWLRSTKGPLSYKTAHPFIVLPFGFGARSCLGKRFAHCEMEVLLAKLLRNYRVEWTRPPKEFTMDMFYGVSGALPFKITPVDV